MKQLEESIMCDWILNKNICGEESRKEMEEMEKEMARKWRK